MLHGQAELDAAGAAADDANSNRAFALANALEKRGPLVKKLTDGFDGHHIACGTRREVRGRCGPRIDRQNVKSNRRPIPGVYGAGLDIDPGDRPTEKSRAREARQRRQVDMRLLERVVFGNEPGQHTGVGRLELSADQCESNTRQRAHAEGLQDRDMAVATAEQHDILDHWDCWAHRSGTGLQANADYTHSAWTQARVAEGPQALGYYGWLPRRRQQRSSAGSPRVRADGRALLRRSRT